MTSHTDFSSLLKKSTYTVLYFYPKDNTPGCSLEAKEFSDLIPEFQKQNTQIIGVSKDSETSHQKFKEKLGIPFDLISDTEKDLCTKFQVIGEKSLYGKLFQGVIRSTFLLDQEGNIIKERRNIKAKGHAQIILKEIQTKNQKNSD